MEKTCTFSGLGQTSFWHVQPYDGLTKTAKLEISDKLHPRIQDFVRAYKPTSKGIYVLVNAMGSSEYWSSNANADWWPERGLIHAPPNWDDLSPEEMRRVARNWDYGFPTFLNAHVFTHHQNKDPAKAIGHVVLAVWNPKMHRVELILWLDRAKAMAQGSLHVLERIERGEYPDVSMGCKVPYDVCTICGNRSKTVADYCDCMRRMRNKILPDGRKVAVRNDFPKFFDISIVFIGADKTAKVMAKLAQVGNQNCLGSSCYVRSGSPIIEAFRQDNADILAGMRKTACATQPSCPCPKLGCSTCCVAGAEKYAERIFGVKSAAQRKLSEIIKEIPAGPFSKRDLPRLENAERDLPDDVLDLMGGLGAPRALSTTSMMGMTLKPREFQRLILISIGRKPLADDLARQGRVFAPSDKVDETIPTDRSLVDHRLQELLSLMGFMRDRSAASPMLRRRVMSLSESAPKTAPSEQHDDRPILKKVAALYNGYRRGLLKKATDIMGHLVSDSQLRAELFDSSMAQAFAGGVVKTAGTSVFGPDSLAYLMGAYHHNRDLHAQSNAVAASLAQLGTDVEAAA